MAKSLALVALLAWLLAGMPVSADEQMPREDDIRNHPWYVFLQRDLAGGGADQLIFVDMLTGEEITIAVSGERYTLLRRSVLFFDRASRRVMLATPFGDLVEHPFVQLDEDARRVDWIVAADHSQIAWTLTYDDEGGQMRTVTHIANIDGGDRREILTDGPFDDARALPVEAGENFSTIYLDGYHLDNIEQFTPFNQYASIYALDTATGDYDLLPDEPSNCLCGAAISKGLFLRLRLSSDLQGFDLHVYDLAGRVPHIIPAVQVSNYNTGGDILISPDGTRAVYALARVSNFGTAQQSIQTVFVLVDLRMMTQETLTSPITTFVRPVEWTEDNSAIILTSPARDGTWKITLADRQLERIAEATYLGTLQR
jgi:hypothetical protein